MQQAALRDDIRVKEPLIDPNWRRKPMASHEVVWDKTYEQIDGLYASKQDSLIDAEWKNKPMRPWSDVFDDLCQEVGQAYGLKDIREA